MVAIVDLAIANLKQETFLMRHYSIP